MPHVFPGRRTFTPRALLVLTLGIIAVHCAHPTDDYEAYRDLVKKRTSSNPPPAGCLGTPVTTDVDITGTWIGYCRVNFADASQALRLATRFTKTGASVEAKLTPLKTGAKTVDETVGDPETTASGTIKDGKFELDFGTVKISGAANPISGSDIQLDGAKFELVINSKDEILAELDGQLVKPFMLDLSNESLSDVCVIKRLADGKTLPEPPPGDTELRCRNQTGTGGAGGGTGGTGGSGGEDGTLYCGKKKSELPSISKCDDPMPSECAKAMCAVMGQALDCKKILLDCHADPKCNQAISCGAVCRELDPTIDSVSICGPIAGLSIGKALNYKACVDKLTACGGDGSFDP